MIDAELKLRWVAALRSGKYTQCSSALRKGDSFCCLGVLGDITPGATWQGNTLCVPGAIAAEWFSLLPESWLPASVQGGLATLNDSGDYDFDSIATHIEANL